ncbi:hypothetical protein PsorP6_008440 [Peronosclerospora sorghi]|uniref:Uncharacterized protein n=1 Tax=Peronosclerospora sorghi TaxID=230839 RepID=A0ACC0W7Q0_9STRA|nr:hypothetical protein PsorP6_008440 [Peronosclerospora sorghi]
MEHDDLSGTCVPVPPEVNPMTTLARMGEMMATQQHELAQLFQHQRVMLDQLSSVVLQRKKIDVQVSTKQGRLIAMVASNLKGQEAAWITFNQDQFTTLSELADALKAEFIPPDL